MIDERINNNTGIENEEQEIDLVALLFKYLFYWRWFVASILICCIATYLFLRYQTPVYNISSSVLIKEEDKRSGSGNNPLAAIPYIDKKSRERPDFICSCSGKASVRLCDTSL